jgi:hypothetical protein
MRRASKYSLILLVVAALVSVPAILMASGDVEYQDPQIEVGAMTGDILLARPLGIVATVTGFGLFVISAPFSALGGNIGEAWQALVAYPAEFTFARPLGDFN